MARTDILDDIIARIDPEDVAIDFIIMAKVKDYGGREHILRGHELERLLNKRDPSIVEARLVLNVRKMRSAIVNAINEIYEEVNLRFQEANGDKE